MCDFDGELRELAVMPEYLLATLDNRLARDPDIWRRADGQKPNRFEPFRGSTLHVVLQFPDDLHSHLKSSYTPLWAEWEDAVVPVIANATRSYGYANGRTGRIMFARLLAGQTIARHVDTSPSAAVPHKIHVPLITDPAVHVLIGEGDFFLPRGRAFEVNNRQPHEVRNESTVDRVHLIFDYFDADASSHQANARR